MHAALTARWTLELVTHSLDFRQVWTAKNALLKSFQLFEQHASANDSHGLPLSSPFHATEPPDSTKYTQEMSWCIYAIFGLDHSLLPCLLSQSWCHQNYLLGTNTTSACLLRHMASVIVSCLMSLDSGPTLTRHSQHPSRRSKSLNFTDVSSSLPH